MDTPVPCIWDGEAFRPLPRFAKLCDERFVVHERYPLQVAEQRSMRSHNQYFAMMAEAWQTLPDNVADHFPSPDHLRKHALVRCGYAKSITVPCDGPMSARKLLQEFRALDEFAIVDRSENVVTVWTAESQSMKAMGKERFQRSKDETLTWVSQTFGYEPAQLGKAA